MIWWFKCPKNEIKFQLLKRNQILLYFSHYFHLIKQKKTQNAKNYLASPSFKILVHRHLLPFHCVSIFLVSHPALSSNLSVILIGCRSLSATHIKPEKTEHAVSSWRLSLSITSNSTGILLLLLRFLFMNYELSWELLAVF